MSESDGASDGLGHFGRGRPDVAQEHGLAVGAHAERLADQVGVEGAGKGVGDDERRRGQVVHADVGVDASLEVPVPREHGAHRQVGLGVTASDTPSSRGPELPMQVVHP